MNRIYIIAASLLAALLCVSDISLADVSCAASAEQSQCMAADADENIRDILEQVEQRGRSLESFQGDMLYTREQLLIDTMVLRHGAIYYEVDGQTVRFRIHFSDIQQVDLLDEEFEAPVIEFDEDFTFDGRWAVRRDSRTKMLQRWELSKEPATRESFRLGEGPFPMPFAITAEAVLENFEVSLIPQDPCDPVNTAHLRLVPCQDSSFAQKYVNLDLWIHNPSMIPHQIRYEDMESEITTVRWNNVVADRPISADRFELQPAGQGWTIEEHPLED